MESTSVLDRYAAKRQNEKYENRVQSACENASDAKQSLPKRSFSARSAKTITFRTIQGGNAPRKMEVFSAF